ncbi:hypothetical protein D623_10028112 [Myotis brandtii]|uniref:Uncharacterized protein n=1 Tax=Myotis brandtii TaxID=109478 RepID=S7MRW0_MYOBR|nr:hypothetical protein D623_10028112 [Myotis brandtii]
MGAVVSLRGHLPLGGGSSRNYQASHSTCLRRELPQLSSGQLQPCLAPAGFPNVGHSKPRERSDYLAIPSENKENSVVPVEE